MLPATLKLCCGIAHDHLHRLPGLKVTAIAAIQKDVRGLSVRGSHHLPSKIPQSIQRLMGKEIATRPEPDGDTSSSRLSSVDLSYITQGEMALQGALSILQQHSSWQAETMLDTGATVSSATLPGLGKVFRAEVVLTVPVARLHRELFERIEEMPQWNPTLSQVKVLRRVGTDTLVTHEVTAPSPGNLVGQRDFVSVRHRGRRETAIYLVGTATHVEPLPSLEGCIRAKSQLSCIVLQPLAGEPSHTRFTWLLSVDLKGWIPASVLNRVLPQSQADFIEHLRRHLSATACPRACGRTGSARAQGTRPELETLSCPSSFPRNRGRQRWREAARLLRAEGTLHPAPCFRDGEEHPRARAMEHPALS